MRTSLAAVFTGTPGELELRRIPTPEPQGEEILVRLLGCTLCGSDLHSFTGRRQVAVPTVLGHEMVGEIAAFGPAAPTQDLAGSPLRLGDRVTWSLVASCGNCFFCRRGLPQKCEAAVKYGHEKMTERRGLLGGLAEHCLLVPGTAILRLPDELPLATVCPANCATATAAAVVEAAGDVRDAAVCVLGAGLLGLTVCAMARAAGAADIVCMELDSRRRELSLRFGATRSVAPEELRDVAAAVNQGRGFDAALELTGSPAAFSGAWPLLRIGATFVVAGAVFPAAPVELSLEQLVRRHVSVRGVHNYSPRHLSAAIDFLAVRHREFPFAAVVGRWHSLADAARAFADAETGQWLRVGVDPGSAAAGG